eukprot:m.117719 g.117719  ORF g.117719 m.117719 type:complete len:276 (-) comp21703_c0_seq11:3421-4248(-)
MIGGWHPYYCNFRKLVTPISRPPHHALRIFAYVCERYYMLNVAHFLIRSLFRGVQATLVATKHCTFRSSDPLAPLASRVRSESRARLLTMLRSQRVPWRALRNAAAPIRWTCAVAPTNFVRLCSRSNGQKEPPVTVARGIDVRVGQVATATVTFTKEDVATFAELVGDHNGIHIDSEVAAASRYGKCVVHGMLLNSALSAVIANELPGPGTVYVKQTIRFRSPVYVDEPFVARIEVLDVRKSRKLAVLSTVCHSPGDPTDVLVEGETLVLLDKHS